jgi:hypothetical protein
MRKSATPRFGPTSIVDVLGRSALLLMLTLLGGCEVVGGIFKAGMWSGIIIVIVIVVAIIWLIGRFRGKG